MFSYGVCCFISCIIAGFSCLLRGLVSTVSGISNDSILAMSARSLQQYQACPGTIMKIAPEPEASGDSPSSHVAIREGCPIEIKPAEVEVPVVAIAKRISGMLSSYFIQIA